MTFTESTPACRPGTDAPVRSRMVKVTSRALLLGGAAFHGASYAAQSIALEPAVYGALGIGFASILLSLAASLSFRTLSLWVVPATILLALLPLYPSTNIVGEVWYAPMAVPCYATVIMLLLRGLHLGSWSAGGVAPQSAGQSILRWFERWVWMVLAIASGIVASLGQYLIAAVGAYAMLVLSFILVDMRQASLRLGRRLSSLPWLLALGSWLLVSAFEEIAPGLFGHPQSDIQPYVALATVVCWFGYVLVLALDRRHIAHESLLRQVDVFDEKLFPPLSKSGGTTRKANGDPSEEYLRRQSEFLATMSHELRTPLSCVVGLSRLLSSNEEFGPALRKDMGTIERLSVQLLNTVDEGLAFVRQEPGSGGAEFQVVQMAHLLRDMKSLAHWLADQQRNKLHFHRVRNIPYQLRFDEQKVRQILINLLSNAARYCRDGQITLGVALRESKRSLALEWLIEDTGRGMSPEEQKIFFDPFTKSRDSQGLGIGLALVKRLVDDLDGTISVHSEVGVGTRFRVSLPVRHVQTASLAEDLDDDSRHPDFEEKASMPMVLLPHNDLNSLDLGTLRRYLKLGQLSEIEQWLDRAKSMKHLAPESSRFVQKLDEAVRMVDLDAIQSLIDQVDTPLSFI